MESDFDRTGTGPDGMGDDDDGDDDAEEAPRGDEKATARSLHCRGTRKRKQKMVLFAVMVRTRIRGDWRSEWDEGRREESGRARWRIVHDGWRLERGWKAGRRARRIQVGRRRGRRVASGGC